MSYEGYDQILCANGHFTTRDAYDDREDTCSFCGAEFVWRNDVDQTNCEEFGVIDMSKLLIAETKFDKCNKCGHCSVTEPSRYRIPGKHETQYLREYYHETSGKYHYVQSNKPSGQTNDSL
jgi:hypothetical protein